MNTLLLTFFTYDEIFLSGGGDDSVCGGRLKSGPIDSLAVSDSKFSSHIDDSGSSLTPNTDRSMLLSVLTLLTDEAILFGELDWSLVFFFLPLFFKAREKQLLRFKI